MPTFVPGHGTILKTREDFIVVSGNWVADGYIEISVDRTGKSLYDGKHLGTQYDLYRDEEGNIVRGDGWVVRTQMLACSEFFHAETHPHAHAHSHASLSLLVLGAVRL